MDKRSTSEEFISNSTVSFHGPIASSSPNSSTENYYTLGDLKLLGKKAIGEEYEKFKELISSIEKTSECMKMRYDPNAVYYNIESNEDDSSNADNGSERSQQAGKRKGKKKLSRSTLGQSKKSSASNALIAHRFSPKLTRLAKKRGLSLINDKYTTPKKNIAKYQIASVTPKPNFTAPTTIFRRPNPGEMAISISGSPLLVTSDQVSSTAQMTIPLEDGRVMAIFGKDGLRVDDLPNLDEQTKVQLQKLHNFLGEAIKTRTQNEEGD